MLPPVTVEFVGNATSGLSALTKMTKGLVLLGDAAKVAAESVRVALATIEQGAAKLTGITESADAAKVSLRGMASAARAVSKATGTAATAAEAGMSAISASAERMAVAVDAASASASTGIKGLATESKAAAVGMRTTTAAAAAAGTGMRKAGAEAEGMGGKVKSAGGSLLGLGTVFSKLKTLGPLSLGAVAVASLDLGTKFQTEMTRVSTSAGAPIAQVNAMKGAVLATATSVGMSGTAMAEALYHPVSAGLSLAASLQVVKYAAMEAKISGASLEDTTYGLSSVMKSYNLSAAQAGPTQASLNAIVGQGDMRFQDLNASVKNWVPTAATFGVSLDSAGAALAYFTDRGDSASTAGTKLSLIMTQMAGPSKNANTIYKALGLTTGEVTARTAEIAKTMTKAGVTQTKLAADLKQPDGIVVALTDLKSHLMASGMSADEANSALVRAFGGGKQFKGVAELIQNIGGVKQKFDDITKSATMPAFMAAWKTTTQNLSYQFQQIKAGAENLGIRIGDALLPQVTKFISLLESRGAPIAHAFSGALSGIAQGLTGHLPSAPSVPVPKLSAGQKAVGAFMPKGGMGGGTGAKGPVPVSGAPALTMWQQAGKLIKSIADDIGRAVGQVARIVGNLVTAVGPAAAVIGGALLGALKGVSVILADYLGPALVAVSGFLAAHKQAVSFVVDAFIAWKVATIALAVQQAILTAIMDANPIMLVVLAIGLLVAGFVMAWQHCQTFRVIMTDVFVVVSNIVLTLIQGILFALKGFADGVLSAAYWVVKAFSMIPGPTQGAMKTAANAVGGFKKDVDGFFNGAIGSVEGWKKSVDGMPQQVKLQGNIDDLTKKIDDAKKQLADKNLPAAKQVKLTANIDDWQLQVARAKVQLANTPDKKRAVLTAQISDWQQQIETAKKQLLNAPAAKRATLTADISNLQNNVSQAQSDINNLHGKTVTITYNGVNEGSSGPNGYQSTTGFTYGRADGGIRYAAAGLIDRQAMMARAGSNILWAESSTGGESYIPHAASKRPRSRRIAEETVGILGGRVHWGGGAPAMVHSAPSGTPAAITGGGGTTVVNHVTVNIAGTVTSERNLRDEIQAQLLRLGGRNSQTYQPYHR
jgi:TP901 family phage tail tape measure protein